MHTWIHTCIHSYTYMHPYIHLYTSTYIDYVGLIISSLQLLIFLFNDCKFSITITITIFCLQLK